MQYVDDESALVINASAPLALLELGGDNAQKQMSLNGTQGWGCRLDEVDSAQGSIEVIAVSLGNLSQMYSDRDDPDEALVTEHKSIDLQESVDSYNSASSAREKAR